MPEPDRQQRTDQRDATAPPVTDDVPAASGSERRAISSITPDLTQLKVLAHPIRTKMLGLLRMDGPATATQLAQRLGLNSGATSYHLRQLADHGLVVEDSARGNNRDRWWRAAHESTYSPDPGDDDDQQHALDAYRQAVGVAYLDQLTAALRERAELPKPWDDIAVSSDWALWVRPEQARELVSELHRVLSDFATRLPGSREDSPPDAQQFLVQLHGFPRPGQLADPDAAE